jgi:hypothetical protein
VCVCVRVCAGVCVCEGQRRRESAKVCGCMELGQLRTQNVLKTDGIENTMAISNYILRELIQNTSHNSVFKNTNISQINTSPPGLVLPTPQSEFVIRSVCKMNGSKSRIAQWR